MIKTWKKLEENCNFPFFGKFLHHWKQKWWKIKNDKNMKKTKKTRGKLQFSIFWKIFAPLQAKMMNNEKQMIKNDKKMKKLEENCNFPFFGRFWHHWKQKWWNMKKTMINTWLKNDKTMKKNEENCNLPFFLFLHHWKQKWWNMKNNDKKMINKWKKLVKLQFSIFWKIFAPLEAKMMKMKNW